MVILQIQYACFHLDALLDQTFPQPPRLSPGGAYACVDLTAHPIGLWFPETSLFKVRFSRRHGWMQDL